MWVIKNAAIKFKGISEKNDPPSKGFTFVMAKLNAIAATMEIHISFLLLIRYKLLEYNKAPKNGDRSAEEIKMVVLLYNLISDV